MVLRHFWRNMKEKYFTMTLTKFENSFHKLPELVFFSRHSLQMQFFFLKNNTSLSLTKKNLKMIYRQWDAKKAEIFFLFYTFFWRNFVFETRSESKEKVEIYIFFLSFSVSYAVHTSRDLQTLNDFSFCIRVYHKTLQIILQKRSV